MNEILTEHEPTENSYRLANPGERILEECTKYLKENQRHARDLEIYVPAGLGVLITPERRAKVFSLYKNKGTIYDLPEPERLYVNAVTSGLRFCGAVTAGFEGYKLLTHAGNPKAVRDLTHRALDLAKTLGARLESIELIVSFNHRRLGFERFDNPASYISQVHSLEERINRSIKVIPHPMSSSGRICPP